MENNSITVETLHRLLICDAEAGKLWWRERGPEWFPVGSHGQAHNASKWNAKFSGREAFTHIWKANGYFGGAIFNRSFLAHRVIFAMAYGYWATGVDHINGIKTDNRISNLREATQRQNMMNVPGRKAGPIGVHQHSNGKWIAQIRHQGKTRHLGCFSSAEEAARARDTAAIRFRGKFARLNFPEGHAND